MLVDESVDLDPDCRLKVAVGLSGIVCWYCNFTHLHSPKRKRPRPGTLSLWSIVSYIRQGAKRCTQTLPVLAPPPQPRT